MKKVVVILLAMLLSISFILPAAAQPAADEYPMFEEYKVYLLGTLLQDSFWAGKEDQLRGDLDAALTPDAECILNFTGTAAVDQAPPGVVFPLTYEAWFAENGTAAQPKKAVPGTYTDGTSTMTLEEDGTFVITTVGQNMEGAEFTLTVKGTASEDGEIAITGVFDGDLDLTELASEEQLNENLEIAKALYEIALKESAGADDGQAGTYASDKGTLEIAEDGTFVLTTKGANMEGAEFTLTVKGTVDEAGTFAITGVFDGDLDLTELASPEQLQENLDILNELYAAGKAE